MIKTIKGQSQVRTLDVSEAEISQRAAYEILLCFENYTGFDNIYLSSNRNWFNPLQDASQDEIESIWVSKYLTNHHLNPILNDFCCFHRAVTA